VGVNNLQMEQATWKVFKLTSLFFESQVAINLISLLRAAPRDQNKAYFTQISFALVGARR